MARDDKIPWALLAALAGVAALALMRSGGSESGGSTATATFALRNFRPLRQADAVWKDILIGASSKTIGAVGCLLTALTMASNYLRGTSLTPPDTNEIGKMHPGSFSGANTVISTLAAAIGLGAPESLRLRSGSVSSLRARIDSTLSRGGVAILAVDYNRSGTGNLEGDHFILCLDQQAINPKDRAAAQESLDALLQSQRNAPTKESAAALQPTIDRLRATVAARSGAFLCADPATGTIIPIDAETLTGPSFKRGTPYLVVGVAPVFRKDNIPSSLV